MITETTNESDKNPDLASAMDAIFAPLVAGDTTVGAAIGVLHGDKRYTFFYGERARDSGVVPDEHTVFEIGSITKTMTATLLADQVLQGAVTLATPVEDLLPNVRPFPRYEEQRIELRHLANHTSSLPRLPNNLFSAGFVPNDPYAHYHPEQLYDFLQNYRLTRPVGSQEEYSNLGFGLLAHALAVNADTTATALLQQTLFAPLGMSRTATAPPARDENIATVYNGQLKAVPMWQMGDATLGAGAVNSTLHDMLNYLNANLHPDHSTLAKAMTLAHEPTQSLNPPMSVGLAWVHLPLPNDGPTMIWHNGGTGGSVAFIGFVPEQDAGVVMLFNTSVHDRGAKNVELYKAVAVFDLLRKLNAEAKK